MSKSIAQLYILPFAGGSKSAFKEFENLIDADIEVITIEYPGRGSRIREPFSESMDDLIEDAKCQIIRLRNKEKPFCLLGYSMGCEVVFDLVQYILEEEAAHLFFCARESIEYDTRGHDYSLLNEEAFAKRIFELGGIDERIMTDKRFFKIAMRPIYADYKLLHEYKYKEKYGQLKQDMTVFYCNKDTPNEIIYPWRNHIEGTVDFYEFGDNHFFINQFGKEMAKIVSEKIKTAVKR